MRYSLVIIILFYLVLLMTITSDCREAIGSSSSFRKWSISYKSQQGIQNLEGSYFGNTEQAAGHRAKPTNQEKSEEYSTETENSSNMDIDDIVYHIDYHGATTHPTPTPKHPKP